MKENSKIIAINRKAFHDYEIIQKYEAGIELHGSEVKSIREGKINLKDSYAILKKNQIFIIGMHIGQYSHTGFLGHDPYRNRKLLLHKKEILKIFNQVKTKGKTLIPLKFTFKCLRTLATTFENPHCGESGVPFINRHTSLFSIS